MSQIMHLYTIEVNEKMNKKSVVLRFPETLLKRVDHYKNLKGFGTRTQAIFHLLHVALEDSNHKYH